MTSPELITQVEIAIEKALRGESKLDAETLAIGGFSTPTMRMLYNGLCSNPVTSYLEIGAFRGASCCAAACGNENLRTFVVEDFSQPFGEDGVQEDLLKNIAAVKPKTGKITLIRENCWTADLSSLPPIDCFMYDGHHDEQYQARALPHFFDKLADSAIVWIDDFEWTHVARGTWTGFDKLFGKIHIDRQWAFLPGKPDSEIWHNGLGIFVVSKL